MTPRPRGVRATTLLSAIAASAVLAAPAGAEIHTVQVGARGLPGLPADASLNAFFGGDVTVHAGDSVRWHFAADHVVLFPALGAAPPPSARVNFERHYVGYRDAAGAPFWFEDEPMLEIPWEIVPRTPGPDHDGSAVSTSGMSGLARAGTSTASAPPDYTVRFPRAGSYPYICRIHRGMTGVVRVVAAGEPLPAASRPQEAIRNAVRAARKLEHPRLARAEVRAGNDQRPVSLLRFFPRTLKVRVGQTVTFRSGSSQEIHTVTFGPSAYVNEQRRNQPLVGPPMVPGGPPMISLNPMLYFPTDLPHQLAPYDRTRHGNGFLNLGVLHDDPALRFPELGPESTAADRHIHAHAANHDARWEELRFARPGTYTFRCLFHPSMTGRIIVR